MSNYNDGLAINKTIRKMMIDKDFNNKDIAKVLGVSHQTISNNLSSRKNLTINTIDDYSKALGYSVRVSFVDSKSGEVVDVG